MVGLVVEAAKRVDLEALQLHCGRLGFNLGHDERLDLSTVHSTELGIIKVRSVKAGSDLVWAMMGDLARTLYGKKLDAEKDLPNGERAPQDKLINTTNKQILSIINNDCIQIFGRNLEEKAK